MDGKSFWGRERGTVTAGKDLDLVLCSTIYLPMPYWRKHFFFTGAADSSLYECTEGRFPAKLVEEKKRPVFILKPITEGPGAVAAPCTSKKPYRFGRYYFVKEGCQLLHTNFQIDRNSYILDKLRFNVPASLAVALRFRGEVPSSCLEKKHYKG